MTSAASKAAKDLQLLDECIAHWKKIRALNPDHQPGGNQCALCRKYIKIYRDDACSGCPINTYTDAPHCYGTPFYKADEAFRRLQRCLRDTSPGDLNRAFHKTKFETAADEEIAFLERVREQVATLIPKE